MKNKILTTCIFILGAVSFTNAQDCDCLPLLEETISKVEKHFEHQSKNISKEKLEYLKWLEKFRTLATKPHSKEDCHTLIQDYLNILEDEDWVHQFNFKKSKMT